MSADLTERLIKFSPDLAVQILAKVEHEFHMVAKTDSHTIEPWYGRAARSSP
jgi:hypothetical protein